jgi:hypothetical protein
MVTHKGARQALAGPGWKRLPPVAICCDGGTICQMLHNKNMGSNFKASDSNSALSCFRLKWGRSEFILIEEGVFILFGGNSLN